MLPRPREHLWLLLPGDWRQVPVLRRTVADLLALAREAGAKPDAPAPAEEGGEPRRWAG